MSTTPGIVESTIRSKLQTALDASHVDVINESYMHNVPKGAETHFKVVVVSEQFDSLPLLKVLHTPYTTIFWHSQKKCC